MLPSSPVKSGSYSSVLWEQWVTAVSEENYDAAALISSLSLQKGKSSMSSAVNFNSTQLLLETSMLCSVNTQRHSCFGFLCLYSHWLAGISALPKFCHWGCTNIDFICFSVRWISMPTYQHWHQIYREREKERESLIVKKKEEYSSGFGLFLPLCTQSGRSSLWVCSSPASGSWCFESH